MLRQRIREWVIAAFLLGLNCAAAIGQDDAEPLRLDGLFPVGGRVSLTESWGTLQFTVANWSYTAKQARVVVFYPNRPDVRYARDVWVPARARATSWLSVGPVPDQPLPLSREIAYQLFDRTDGTDRQVRGREPEKLRTRDVLYHRREPTTALYLDSTDMDGDDDALGNKDSSDFESLRLAQTFRGTRGLSDRVSVIRDRYLPPDAGAYDGIDHFVIAANRLASDPAGQQALRHWVLNGGTLWVLLDRVDPDVVAPILGEGLRFQVVGRTSFTTVRLRSMKQDRIHADREDFDRPVEFAQVLLSGSETVSFEANDWPAVFSQSVGKGRVFFTTLGARAWYRPRGPRDPASRLERIPDLPIANDSFQVLTALLQPERQSEELNVQDLTPLLTAEVGYEVVSRRTAGIILTTFLLGLLGVAIWLRKSRSPEIIGVIGPLVAVVATAAFVIVGMKSRQAVSSTAAAVAIVSISSDGHEARWRGLFAVYNPESGIVQLNSQHGGRVELDQSGLEGVPRYRVETDLDSWHWENLSFPAGVRVGPFQSTSHSGVSAIARFGANGLEGRLKTGSFRNPADAVLQTRSRALIAMRFTADGSFQVNSGDILPADQYLLGAVLTDRQQRRQDLYRRIFSSSKSDGNLEQDRLFVWMETDELPFDVPGATRSVGMVLFIIPLQYEPPGAGPVTIPDGFLPYAAMTNGRSHTAKLESSEPTRLRLRFQLPELAQTMTAERAVLRLRLRAPGRDFSVFGIADDKPVLLREQLNFIGPVQVEITDRRFLRTDSEGGLYLELVLSERLGPDGREKPIGINEQPLMWEVEALGLEMVGRIAGK